MRGLRIGTVSIAVLLIIMGALTWAGCGGEESPGTTSSGSSAGITAGLEPFVAGAMLTDTKDGTETTVGDVTEDRDWTYVFQVEASDPRATGNLEVIFNADAPRSGGAKFWGTCVLTNSQGTWVCDGWNGAMTDVPTHQFTFSEYKGTGAYEGLAMYIQWHMIENSSEMLPPSSAAGTAVSGWIQKVL